RRGGGPRTTLATLKARACSTRRITALNGVSSRRGGTAKYGRPFQTTIFIASSIEGGRARRDLLRRENRCGNEIASLVLRPHFSPGCVGVGPRRSRTHVSIVSLYRAESFSSASYRSAMTLPNAHACRRLQSDPVAP